MTLLLLSLFHAFAADTIPPVWTLDANGLPVVPQELSAAVPRNPDIHTGVLDNGVTWFVRAHQQPEKRVDLRMTVAVGSLAESEKERGIAHFVEHMAFNGSASFPGNGIIAAMESMGMKFGQDQNAATHPDRTVYKLTLPTDDPAQLELGLKILVEQASALSFDGDECERERGVVVEEWRRGTGLGERKMTAIRDVLFEGSRFEDRLPIGDLADVGADLECKTAARFWRRWYRPDTLSVAVVGDVDPAVAESAVAAAFGAIPSRGGPKVKTYDLAPHEGLRVAGILDPEEQDSAWSVSYVLPVERSTTLADQRRDTAAGLALVAAYLRLMPLTHEENSPISEVGPSFSPLSTRTGLVELVAKPHDGREAEALERFWTEIARLERYGFTADEVERARGAVMAARQRSAARGEIRSNAELAESYAGVVLDGPSKLIDDPVWAGLASPRLVGDLTVDEVNTSLRRDLIPTTDRVVFLIGSEQPNTPGEAAIREIIARVEASEITRPPDAARARPLVPQPPEPVPMPAPVQDATTGVWTWNLPNGATVLLKTLGQEKGSVRFRAYSPGGRTLSPVAQMAAAQAADEVRKRSGLGEHNVLDLFDVGLGHDATVNASIGGESESIQGKAAVRDMELALQQQWLAFTAPRFDAEALAAYQRDEHDRLSNRLADPDERFGDAWTALFWGNHPLMVETTPEQIDAIRLEDARAQYQQRFSGADDFVFVFVGDITPEALSPLVARWIGALPAGPAAEKAADVGVRRASVSASASITGSGGPKTITQVTWRTAERPTPQLRVELGAVATVLEHRLTKRLREELGGTYTVSASSNSDDFPEPDIAVRVRFACEPSRQAELEAAMEVVVSELAANGPTADEVAQVKSERSRSWEKTVISPSSWLDLLVFTLSEGRPLSDIVDFGKRTDALDAAAIQGVARRVLGGVRVELVQTP